MDVTDPRQPRSRRGRPAKPPLSRAVIVDAALELVRQDSLEAVTLRNVAERLDTGPASLYVYVANREDLLERMLEQVLSQVPAVTVDPARWREQLTGLFTAALDALCRYPGLAQVALGSIPAWPSALAITETALALLRAGGIPDQAAAWATDALYLVTVATAVEDGIGRLRKPTAPHHKSLAADYAGPIRDLYAALPANRYPNIASMAVTLTEGDEARRFTFAINAIISGARAAGPAAEARPDRHSGPLSGRRPTGDGEVPGQRSGGGQDPADRCGCRDPMPVPCQDSRVAAELALHARQAALRYSLIRPPRTCLRSATVAAVRPGPVAGADPGGATAQ